MFELRGVSITRASISTKHFLVDLIERPPMDPYHENLWMYRDLKMHGTLVMEDGGRKHREAREHLRIGQRHSRV